MESIGLIGLPLLKRQMPFVRHPPTNALSTGCILPPMNFPLPIGRGKFIGGNMHPVLNAFVGGWRTNGIWRFHSGRPIHPMLYISQSLPTYGPQRPNLIGTPHRAGGKDSDWINQYF